MLQADTSVFGLIIREASGDETAETGKRKEERQGRREGGRGVGRRKEERKASITEE